MKIALAAPTGRAAKRMEQSLAGQDEAGPASTLHKLLKIRFDSGEPGYDRDNPLPADLVVIDEASMVDLRMMSLLFDALPPRGHLLLVGDKDQLPSVEAGALFADFLHRADEEGHRLHNRVLMLRKIYRSNREIITLAGKIIEGRTAEAVELLKKSEGEGAVRYRSLSERTEPLYREVSAFYGESAPFSLRGFS